MKIFAKVLLAFGMVMVVLSFLLCKANISGSPEAVVSTINIGLGLLMVFLAAVYLVYQKKKNTTQQEQPSSKDAKGEGDEVGINDPNDPV